MPVPSDDDRPAEADRFGDGRDVECQPGEQPHQIRDRERARHLPPDLDIGGLEFQCAECASRCTESPDSDVEYGHQAWCRHSTGRLGAAESDSRATKRRRNAEQLEGAE